MKNIDGVRDLRGLKRMSQSGMKKMALSRDGSNAQRVYFTYFGSGVSLIQMCLTDPEKYYTKEGKDENGAVIHT
jgi:hypothetical protein